MRPISEDPIESDPRSPRERKPLVPHEDELDSQVQRAQEQLLQLRRQQDLIERQKRELEELSRRQDEFERGRKDVQEKMTRSLVSLEREQFEAQKRAELMKTTRESFERHLSILDNLDPSKWSKTEIHRDLSMALSAVDDAAAEFDKSRSRIAPSPESSGSEYSLHSETTSGHSSENRPPASTIRGFGYWFTAGFAFTLPLLLLFTAFFTLLIYYINFPKR